MKKIFTYIILFVTSIQTFSQSIVWEQMQDYGSGSTGIIINRNKDSTFIISGAFSESPYWPFFYLKIDSDGNIIWQKWGRKTDTGEQDIHERPNGGFIYTGTVGIGNSKVFLQKINTFGDTVWAKDYDNPYYYIRSTAMLILPNEDYVISGSVSDIFNRYYFLQKTDSLGNLKWHKLFAKDLNSLSASMIINKEGNFVISGASSMYDHSPPYAHPYMIEVSFNGDSVRSGKIIFKGNTDLERHQPFWNNIIQTSDDGYVFSGTIDSAGVRRIGYIAKVDTAFNLKWSYQYKSLLNDQIHFSKVAEMEDSSIVALANEGFPYSNVSYVFKVSKDGQFISKDTYTSAIATQILNYDWEFIGDSSAIIIGRDYGTYKSYMARIDNIGVPYTDTDSCRTFTASFKAEQNGDSIQFINTSNGGYAYADESIWKFSDSTSSSAFSPKIEVIGIQDSIWARLIATNPYGCKDTIEKKVKVFQTTDTTDPILNGDWKVIVYPNPSSDIFNFKNTGNNSTKFKLSLLNSIGQQVGSFEFNSNEFQLNVDLNVDLSDGMYFYLITDEKGNARSGKLMVE